MKGFIKSAMAVVVAILICSVIMAIPVYAADKRIVTASDILQLKITREDGINITPQDKERICTCMPLKYEPDAKPMPELFNYKINK